GMRGTGSNSVLAESVHVPYHRTFLLADLTAGRPGAGLPRCHGAPAHLAGALMFAAPALGAATRALHLWTHRTSTSTGSTGTGTGSTAAASAHGTGTPGTDTAGTPAAASGTAEAHGAGSTAAAAAHGSGTPGTGTGTAGTPAAGTGIAGTPAIGVGAAVAAGSVGVGTAVAGRGVAAGTADTLTRSSGEVEAARLLLIEAARRADTEPVTDGLVARNRRDAVLAVTLLATAVRRLADTTGPHEDEQGTTLLRLCRDVTTVASHGALRMEPAAEAYAAAVLRPVAP
ncbi:hypothetical protein ACFXMO_08445, partial [Kitasatospora indigofera]